MMSSLAGIAISTDLKARTVDLMNDCNSVESKINPEIKAGYNRRDSGSNK